MRLYLVRHARAKDATDGMSDAERPLTKKGRAEFELNVQRLESEGVRFDRVYHSPLLRAVETADLLAPLLEGLDGETIVTPRLADAPSRELLDAIEGESVALVGHEPWLSDLLFWLVTGWQLRENRGGSVPFRLQKGAVAVLEGSPQPGAMSLVALYPIELGDEREY